MAPREALIRPVISGGPLGYESVNVAAQGRDSGSLLSWFRRLIRARRECPELGRGTGEVFDSGHDAVFGMRTRWEGRTVVTVHNLGDEPADVRLDPRDHGGRELVEVFGDGPGGDPGRLGGYGYRWYRVREG